MHLAVDMDDVILDFCGGLKAALKTEYGVEGLDFTEWDLHKVLDPIIGYSWWKWMRERDWLWKNFPAIEGSIGGLDKLAHEGHYIEIVTSKPDWARHAVPQWLGLWRPYFNRVTIVSMDDNKVDMSEADLLIDDKYSNCAGFADAGRMAIQYEREHNIGDPTHPRIVRARNWREVVDLVHNIDERKVEREPSL